LLNRVFEELNSEDSQFDAIDLWDLGHQTPRSDEAFIEQLKIRLAEAFKGKQDEISQLLNGVDGGDYSAVEEVIQYASNDGLKVLMLWDGFDKPLHSGLLTRNLWDQLRELAMLPGICLVTASRRPLHELLRSEDAATSDFWGIFESTVNLSCFSNSDCKEILAGIGNLEFDAGAQTELHNFTAGYPPLFLSLLNQIVRENEGGTIDHKAVCEAAQNIGEIAINIVRDMWNDCQSQAQDLYRSLMISGELSEKGLPKDHSNSLLERGFAHKVGNKLACGCRLLSELLGSIEGGAIGLSHLFGDWSDYRQNIRRVLEHRLEQIQDVDDGVRRLVSRAIEDIPDYPDHCLNSLTHIEDSILDSILRAEFGNEKYFPEQIWDEWNKVNAKLEHKLNTVARLEKHVNKPIPSDRGLQIGMLQLLTGSHQSFDSKAKLATKDMYVLLNAIHSYRNRTQHADGEEMDVGVAVAGLMICIELLGCIDRARQA
jgi:hypothetical protein